MPQALSARSGRRKSGAVEMRTVVFRVANSLDNFIAREDGAYNWILSGEGSASIMAEFWKTIDIVVVGRKTYEPVLKSGKPFPTYPGVKNYVLSRTLKESPDENVEIIREDVAKFIRKLKNSVAKPFL